jgi:DNA repair protein RadA/Sms
MLALETRLQIRRRNLFIVADGEVEMILSEAEAIKPKFLIVDSLQGLFRSRRADILANRLVEFAENNRIALVLVSHLGKSTHCIPLRLEHLVAGVLELEHFGDPLRHFLRATKMRTARLVSTELKMNETGFAFARKGRA